jgi:cyclophilin family peptidyl-prolyl cis-trans isomerase
MGNRKTRDKQLAKLAARRAASRRKKRQQRLIAAIVGITVAVAGLGFGLFVLTRHPKVKPGARNGPSAIPSVSSSAGPVACGGSVPRAASHKKPTFSKAPKMAIGPTKTYTLTMRTSCGTMVIELDPKTAPKTVNSIVFLVQHHFYDGLTFHRIVKDFVIQGGDPKGDGSGGPGYSTVDTPPANAQYPVGAIAMAKTQSEAPGTAGSQFFVVTSASAQAALAPQGQGGLYALVGHVTRGLDVVDKIAAVPIADATTGAPAERIYIVKVTLKVS